MKFYQMCCLLSIKYVPTYHTTFAMQQQNIALFILLCSVWLKYIIHNNILFTFPINVYQKSL